MKRVWPVLIALPLLGACASTGAAPLPPAATATPDLRGLTTVMGQTAGALTRLFGEPQADVAEPPARKLQFSSGACVLDAYLYPTQGSREPRVTHVDARNRTGAEVDRAACVEALKRR